MNVGCVAALNLGLPLNLPYLHPEATGERMLKGVNFASAASGYLQATSRLLVITPFNLHSITISSEDISKHSADFSYRIEET